MKIELTDNESKFLRNYFQELAKARGEDIIGILMVNGAFNELPNNELVEFAKKLEGCSYEL